MKKLILLMFILSCCSSLHATPQLPDSLIYQNKKFTVHMIWGYPSPLLTYFNQKNMPSPFIGQSTANYRGHVSVWEIRDDKLFLNKIWVREIAHAPREYDIKSKVDSARRGENIFADWFSGMISCPDKKDTYIFHIRYGEVTDIQRISKKDLRKIKRISEKDTSNHVLLDRLSILFFNENYVSFYFRLNEPDIIHINGREGRFKNRINHSPILEYFSNEPLKWPFNWENFEKNGAPNCLWNITDNRVFLENVQLYSGNVFDEIKKEDVTLEEIFKDKISGDNILADWLNGVYRIEYGSEKKDESIPDYKRFTPTEYSYLRIKGGIITESYSIPGDFNFREIPEDTEPELKQIIREFGE